MERSPCLVSNARQSATFPMFNHLPPELRIKIWQHAMPGARTVVIAASGEVQTPAAALDRALADLRNLEETWQSATQVPALLHVNAEARHEALKHYALSLAVGSAQPRIYVDFSRDTLFFGHSALRPDCSDLWSSTRDMNKIRSLAVVPEGAWRILRWKQADLKSIEKIVFVHDTEGLDLGSEPVLVEDASQELMRRIDEDMDVLDETQVHEAQQCILDPVKKRMQAAQEELDTLMTILPTQWATKPTVSTGVFR
ncbi:hypothetical protein F4778DRAFT_36903 [Xylariomycetidae sp. FL2044]|nr:hypothetical protein F4778DRAFT_660819 [Xylariomycetidae sp. FL2044]KAH9904649.1 hypothetical protein F4778DRAFT_36903 [Xylariomycetidae sp. FL2044]